MKAIFLTALIAVCSSAKLDRTYLPPASAKTAGGSSDILQPPVTKNQGLGGLPAGSFENAYQGIVVDAAVGSRASDHVLSGLGAPRISYGSTHSKVGEAAFRDKHLQGGASFLPQGFLTDQSRPERVQANRDRISNTVRLETNIQPEHYNYLYETDNGITASENAILVDGVKAQGGYSYTGDDGQVYTVTYTADEDGYQPKGAHLPTPPPIPVEILKSLEQNAKDEAAGLVDDGSYDAKKYNTGGDYLDSSDNDRVNDRQSNKFANRPESNTQISGSFINQNNQALRPNTNAQSSISSFNKDANQPGQFNLQLSGIPSSFAGSTPQTPNKPIHAISQSNYFLSNKFGQNKPEQHLLNKEYLPPIGQQFTQHDIFGQNINGTVITTQEASIPLSQQNLQNDGNRQNTLSLPRPTSYEISSVGQVSPSQNFGSNIQKDINAQIKQEQFNENMPQPNKGSSVFTGLGNSLNKFGSPLTTMFPQKTQTLSTFNNIGNNNSPSESINRQSESNLFAQQTIFPTNQPSRELTTPFDSRPSIDFNNDRKSTSPVSSFSTSEANSNSQNFAQKPNLQRTKDTQYFSKSQTTNEQQDTLINQPMSTYEGELYQYNKPPLVQQNDSRSENFTQKPTFAGSVDTQNINIRPQTIGQQITSSNLPINTYEGEIYQYNKPASSIPTSDAQLFSQQSIVERPHEKVNLNNKSTASGQINTSYPSNNYKGEIYQYNKPMDSRPIDARPQDIAQKPTFQGFMNNKNFNIRPQTFYQQGVSINQPMNSNDGEIYQYNKPSSMPNNIIQNPSNAISINRPESAFIQIPNDATSQAQTYNQFNQATTTFIAQEPSSQTPTSQSFQGSNLQTRPTDVSVFPNTPSNNQYTQSPGFFNTQAFFSQQPALDNKRPPQNSFLQTRPTMPSFSQTNINQYKQPQGSDGSYYYDKPSKQFQQQFPSSTFNQNKINQRPQFVDETQPNLIQSIAPTVQSPYQFQNNNKGITQASASSFGSTTSTQQESLPIQPLSPNSQTSQQISTQLGPSSFTQTFGSTQSFPTTKPQGQIAIVGQIPSVNTDSEIYQYNKPAESLPSTQQEINEEKKDTASINGQLKPQSIVGLDKEGPVVEMMNFQPANTQFLPQGMNLNQNINIAQQGQQTPESSVPSKPDQSIAVLEQNPNSRPLGSTILGSPCCKGNLQFNKLDLNQKQFNVQTTIKPEQPSIPIGEQFDINRKPPTFDSTGYHY